MTTHHKAAVPRHLECIHILRSPGLVQLTYQSQADGRSRTITLLYYSRQLNYTTVYFVHYYKTESNAKNTMALSMLRTLDSVQ